MLKRHKDLLRPLVANLRAILAGATSADGTWQRGDLDRELERLGIAPDGTAIPIDALPNPTAAERRARIAADAYLTAAMNGLKGTEAEQKRRAAREEFVERAAYTWINRLLALRTMEARGLIDETLRANPDYEGIPEALFVLRQTDPARCAGADGGWWAVVEDACKVQAAFLPGLFDLGDPSAALRPSTAALLRCVALIGGVPAGFTLAEADAAFAGPDAIGWAYQFYQEAAKARVYEKLGSGGKAASRAEIAAATQLFTEPYMVQWLLQNSLGRSYHEAYPDSKLPEAWAYYIRQRPEGQTAPESPRPLEALDLIDPCCGSGHFLREAFDIFAAMYCERHPHLSAAEIADRILERHLHGIDLDPRAAQLAALTLYLRAWEFVKDEGKRQKAKGLASITYHPPALNIATTPSFSNLQPSSFILQPFLTRHLRRHPQDRLLAPLLEGVFKALEQADILGSLLRPAEHIEAAMKALQQPHTVPMDFDADDAALRRTITTMARHDPAELKRMLLDRVAQSFAAESGNADDVAAQLFGREAERGVRLLQLLDRKYAVVATNPPYMGSKNMGMPLKKYVERHYPEGKRDLFASFILRSLELCRSGGRVAMITLHTFLATTSFVELRKKILQVSKIDKFVHLGTGTMKSLSNPNAQGFCMYVFQESRVSSNEYINSVFFRLVDCQDKEEALLSIIKNFDTSHPRIFLRHKNDFINLPGYQFAYYLNSELLMLLIHDKGRNHGAVRANQYADFVMGLSTANNERYSRCYWEVRNLERWKPLVKGGGYSKWAGLEWLVVDWQYDGSRVKSYPLSAVRNEYYYLLSGLTYTMAAHGNVALRKLKPHSIFEAKSPGIFVRGRDQVKENLIMLSLSSKTVNYILRSVNPTVDASQGYTEIMPIPHLGGENQDILNRIGDILVLLKRSIVARKITELDFNDYISASTTLANPIDSVLHLLEGFVEKKLQQSFSLSQKTIEQILDETGTPAGFHPLLAGYDALPDLPADLDLPPLPQEVIDYLAAHQRIVPPPAELRRIKARLRALYEAGPGASSADDEEPDTTDNGQRTTDDDEAVSGAHIPIPTETFLEELSVKMQLHPISVYWLLEELRAEGAHCKPEEQRLLEDRLSVLILRLLGHRWPKQIEAGELVPTWADPDGIIPITPGAGETTLADRLRARLRAEDGDLGVQHVEALLAELTGLTLEEWVRREFFKRHMRQFKYRPIAWHLASKPSASERTAGTGRGRRSSVVGRRPPAFECIVYYHACGGDVLARIRTQYVEPLLRAERQRAEDARRANDETAAALATGRIQELEAFAAKLRHVADEGFEERMKDEGRRMKDAAGFDAGNASVPPLDRWDGDGYLAPATYDDFLRQEHAWRVDLNDGVRVNIAPVQLAGLLVSDVLKAADARKALADRARWRSDERRWVRAGKLPRCGWMDEGVPESRKWTELVPQRAAEKAKLEEKRRTIMGR
jgi:hypothetical protein